MSDPDVVPHVVFIGSMSPVLKLGHSQRLCYVDKDFLLFIDDNIDEKERWKFIKCDSHLLLEVDCIIWSKNRINKLVLADDFYLAWSHTNEEGHKLQFYLGGMPLGRPCKPTAICKFCDILKAKVGN